MLLQPLIIVALSLSLSLSHFTFLCRPRHCVLRCLSCSLCGVRGLTFFIRVVARFSSLVFFSCRSSNLSFAPPTLTFSILSLYLSCFCVVPFRVIHPSGLFDTASPCISTPRPLSLSTWHRLRLFRPSLAAPCPRGISAIQLQRPRRKRMLGRLGPAAWSSRCQTLVGCRAEALLFWGLVAKMCPPSWDEGCLCIFLRSALVCAPVVCNCMDACMCLCLNDICRPRRCTHTCTTCGHK